MADRDSVIRANRAFYDAFQSLDTSRMESVWHKDSGIVCVHPGWRRLRGWGPVMTSWERIFDNVFEMEFQLGEMDVMIGGDLAVVIVEENLTQRGYDGVSKSQVLATNTFRRVGDQWLMVLHHGSPVLAPPDNEPPLQ